jgi:uncharacterized protein
MHRLIVATLALLPVTAAAQNSPDTLPVVVTQGSALVQRAPDRAFINASVETRAGNPRDAQRQNADAMNSVMAKLAGASVPKDAIRPLGYDIQQEFDYVNGKRISRGYAARHSIEITIGDVTRVGEILDVVVQAGANAVNGVRFDLSDRAAVEREALKLAVADARLRADAAAAGAGRTIDRILRIDDGREPPLIPLQRAAVMTMEKSQETPIEPGVIEIQARVTVTAVLK